MGGEEEVEKEKEDECVSKAVQAVNMSVPERERESVREVLPN